MQHPHSVQIYVEQSQNVSDTRGGMDALLYAERMTSHNPVLLCCVQQNCVVAAEIGSCLSSKKMHHRARTKNHRLVGTDPLHMLRRLA